MSSQKILIIDDDPLVLRTLRKLLEREGYLLDSAKSPEEGLQKGNDGDLQLIISDIRMPGMDGLSLVKQIKTDRVEKNQPEIPVIFITGYANDDAPIEAQSLGAKDYLLKPFDLDQLLISVNKALEKMHGECA